MVFLHSVCTAAQQASETAQAEKAPRVLQRYGESLSGGFCWNHCGPCWVDLIWSVRWLAGWLASLELFWQLVWNGKTHWQNGPFRLTPSFFIRPRNWQMSAPFLLMRIPQKLSSDVQLRPHATVRGGVGGNRGTFCFHLHYSLRMSFTTSIKSQKQCCDPEMSRMIFHIRKKVIKGQCAPGLRHLSTIGKASCMGCCLLNGILQNREQ